MLPRVALILGILIVGLTPLARASQAPDQPGLPVSPGICRPEDAPGPGWSTVRIPGLNLQVVHPYGWTPWEELGRVTLLDAGRLVVRISLVDTGGLEPMAWLRAQLQTKASPQCRVVAVGAFVGYQCMNPHAGAWVTYLLASHRVLAVEAATMLSREVHCGVLTGLVDLAESRP